MNTERMPNRRLLVLIAFSVLLLFLTAWFLGKRVPQASENGVAPNASAVALVGISDSPDTSLSYSSRIREVRAKDRIPKKVKSLLNLRANEIGIVTIPEAALDQYFGAPMDPSISNSPILRNIIAKESLVTNLESILKQEGSVKVQVIDQSITEYSGRDFQLKIEVVDQKAAGQNVDIYALRIQLTTNGLTMPYELSVFSGHSLVYRLPPPADLGLVILVGNDPSPATANTK